MHKSVLIAGIAGALFTLPTQTQADDFWHKTWHELDNAGKDINKTAIKVGKGAEHLGQQVGKTFCDLMTMGQYSQGNAGCNINAGVGRDSKGTYVYNPSDPDKKYRGDESDENKGPTDQRLSEMVRTFKESQIQTWEYEDQDVYGIKRFLPPNTTIGEAWPNADRELKPPTKSGEIRPCCKGGGGGFLATRNDHGHLRFHAGVDYVDHVGEKITAVMSGWVQRMKNPGRPGLTGLLIVNDRGYTASIYYIKPTPEITKALQAENPIGVTKYRYRVEAGKTVIGTAQDLHPDYPAEVPQHVHVTLTDPAGNAVAPDGHTRIHKTPSDIPTSTAAK